MKRYTIEFENTYVKCFDKETFTIYSTNNISQALVFKTLGQAYEAIEDIIAEIRQVYAYDEVEYYQDNLKPIEI